MERKGEKKNLYQDTREADEEAKKKDGMEDWDEEKLRQVVLSNHGNPKTTTDKVCKFFVDAVENGKYGWFWSCPNGGDKCMYKHSLPPGYVSTSPLRSLPSNQPLALTPTRHLFQACMHTKPPPLHSFVLKTKEQRAAEKALMDKSPLKTLTLEDYLESERHKLSGALTPVTPDTFATWKKERLDKKAAEDEARRAKEATGRAMFERGGWEGSGDEDEDEGEDDGDGEEEEGEGEGDGEGDEEEGEEDEGAWNLEALRRETEKARERGEEERIRRGGGVVLVNGGGYEGADDDDDEDDDDDDDGGVVETNGVNGHEEGGG